MPRVARLRRTLGVVALTAATALLVGADRCDSGVECGEGTVEWEGECVADCGGVASRDCCGPGTHYDTDLLACATDYPAARCDPDTTFPVAHPDGAVECFGWLPAGCSPPCPAPSAPGLVTICGRLYDLETDQPLRMVSDGELLGDACGPDSPTAGPCGLTVTVESQSLEVPVNNCGAFVAPDLPVPSLGVLALTVDDSDSVTSPVDEHATTTHLIGVEAGATIEDFHAYALRRTTEAAWTADAGDPFGGATFSEQGAIYFEFWSEGQPISGVQVTRDPGVVVPEDDYYFSETDPSYRSTIDPTRNATGFNGAALMVHSGLVLHSGTGGLPDGYQWEAEIANCIPGVVEVLRLHAEPVPATASRAHGGAEPP